MPAMRPWSCVVETQQATNVLLSNLVGDWSNIKHIRNYKNMHHPRILEAVQMVGFRCEGHI